MELPLQLNTPRDIFGSKMSVGPSIIYPKISLGESEPPPYQEDNTFQDPPCEEHEKTIASLTKERDSLLLQNTSLLRDKELLNGVISRLISVPLIEQETAENQERFLNDRELECSVSDDEETSIDPVIQTNDNSIITDEKLLRMPARDVYIDEILMERVRKMRPKPLVYENAKMPDRSWNKKNILDVLMIFINKTCYKKRNGTLMTQKLLDTFRIWCIEGDYQFPEQYEGSKGTYNLGRNLTSIGAEKNNHRYCLELIPEYQEKLDKFTNETVSIPPLDESSTSNENTNQE